MDRRVEAVIGLMDEDIARSLPVANMARLVNLSSDRFNKLFRSETGLPPARYLRSLRMRRAALLLSSTFLSVKEVTARVGFNDESHFVRDFKKAYGRTPTEYRKERPCLRRLQVPGGSDTARGVAHPAAAD